MKGGERRRGECESSISHTYSPLFKHTSSQFSLSLPPLPSPSPTSAPYKLPRQPQSRLHQPLRRTANSQSNPNPVLTNLCAILQAPTATTFLNHGREEKRRVRKLNLPTRIPHYLNTVPPKFCLSSSPLPSPPLPSSSPTSALYHKLPQQPQSRLSQPAPSTNSCSNHIPVSF